MKFRTYKYVFYKLYNIDASIFAEYKKKFPMLFL